MAEEKKIITIVTKYAGQGADLAKKALNELISLGGRTGAALSSAFSSMGKTLFGALGAQKDFFGEVWNFAKESILLAAENARAVNMLAAAYQNVGYTASGAMEQAKAFASQMQSLTGMADEVFLDAQRQLANFGVVGAQAQDSIQAAYALSVNQGMAFESALQLITRAATGSTSALSDFGIVLDDNVKEGEKFQAVLDKINDQFGASAQAAMGDSITKVNALKESWGDLKEGLGNLVHPIVEPILAVLGSLVESFQFFVGLTKMVFDGIAFSAVNAALALKKAFFTALGAVGEKTAYVMDLLNKIPGIEIKAVSGIKEWAASMRSAAEEASRAQKANADDMQKALGFSKKITEEQQKQLDLNAEEVNAKRKIKKETSEIAAEEKKAADEAARRPEAVKRDAGGGMRETFSGWETSLSGKERAREGGLSAGDILSGRDAQFSGLQDIDFLEEQLAAQRDKKLEYLQAELGDTQEYEAAKQEVLAQFNTETARLNQQRAKQNQQIMGSIFSNLISLSSSSNKKLAAVGKAAAIAQATMSTFQGAANALANVPYPLNFAAAASVVAAGMAQVANIAGVELANGGLVKAVTGGVPAIIGEGGSDEAVLPLDNARAMRRIGGAIAEESGGVGGVTVNVNINASGGLIPFLEEMTNATQNGVTEALRYANVAVKAGNAQGGMSV